MALLDIQAMDSARDEARGGIGGSHLSVAICDSFASATLCL